MSTRKKNRIALDNWEVDNSLDPLDSSDVMSDLDKDRFGNFYEYFHGSDPNSIESVPRTTYYVNSNSLSDGDGSIDNPFNKIQSAIDNAVDYDIIEINEGIFTGSGNKDLSFNGKKLMLFSTGGVGLSIVDCENDGRGFSFTEGEDVRAIIQGLTIRNGSPKPTDAYQSGGGIFCKDASPSITNCSIEYNKVTGVSILGDSSLILTNCVITKNSGLNGAGGISASDSVQLNIIGCRISDNVSERGPGGIWWLSDSKLMLKNSIISNNFGSQEGGILNEGEDSSEISIINCTIINNKARAVGGISGSLVSPTTIINSIIWGNNPNQLANGILDVSYSDVQGGWRGISNINEDPRLTPGVFQLQSHSPCIDRGIFLNEVNLDIDGEIRWDDPDQDNLFSIVDIGADEFVDTDSDDLADHWEFQHFEDLSQNAQPDNDTDSLDNLAEFQNGTNPADSDTDDDGLTDGDEVFNHQTSPLLPDTDGDDMLDGWEIENNLDAVNANDIMEDPDLDGYGNIYEFIHNSVPNDKSSLPAPSIYVSIDGESAGDGSSQNPYNSIKQAIDSANNYDILQLADGVYNGSDNKNLRFLGKPLILMSSNGPRFCSIDCEEEGRGFYFTFEDDIRTVVRGITIRRGNVPGDSGGGIVCESASTPMVDNCIIEDNTAQSGGGIYCRRSSPRFLNCIIKNNEATENGGGIFNNSSNPLLVNCLIIQNKASLNGGGITNWNSHVNNKPFSIPTLVNCVIAKNTSSEQGGGVFNRVAGINLSNCTVINNTSMNEGGGIFQTDPNSDSVIVNTVLWGNAPEQILGGEFMVSYSNIQGGWSEGEGNIELDPQLVPNSHRVKARSPCIDSGISIEAPEKDIDGEDRLDDPQHENVFSIVDIGADEFVDTDGDKMADIWELQHFGNLSNDGSENPDNDERTNFEEYEIGTDPNTAD